MPELAGSVPTTAAPDPGSAGHLEGFRARARALIGGCLSEAGVEQACARQISDMVASWLDQSRHHQGILDLPALVCWAAGGDPVQAAPAGAAWWLMRFAAKLFDDVEDGDLSHGLPEAVNLASAALMAAQALILGSAWPAPAGPTAVGLEFARACLVAAGGQHLDLAVASGQAHIDPDLWLSMAQGKSGSLLGWAAWAGAVAAGVDPALACHFRDYGRWLGVLVQIADDYADTWSPTSPADHGFRGSSLALAYGHLVSDGDTRAELELWLKRARDGDCCAAELLRRKLASLGAPAFLVVAARDCRERATRELRKTGCQASRGAPLLGLLGHPLRSVEQAGV
ncbi:MAG: hypothetical protein HPY83_12960 [Anaerolineae bacterium]|nr:hypothetical protein [Anaerolineae bacterium]